MKPLRKVIISVCAQCDWSWHHLSFWAIDGLNHCVIKHCPCSSTELPKHHRGFSGAWMALSLPGLFKHSRCVCSVKRAAHEPGSVTVTRIQGPPDHHSSRTREWGDPHLALTTREQGGNHATVSIKVKYWCSSLGGFWNPVATESSATCRCMECPPQTLSRSRNQEFFSMKDNSSRTH